MLGGEEGGMEVKVIAEVVVNFFVGVKFYGGVLEALCGGVKFYHIVEVITIGGGVSD